MSARNPSGAISRKVIVWLAIPAVAVLLLIGLLIGSRSAVRHKYERARADWKTATLQQLAGPSLTSEDITRELEKLKPGTGRSGREHREWVSDNVLLMANGEYLVYASWHGFNNGYVDHLFLAHGSDGRWLYSTYHFCNQMVGVMFDEPPGSITDFATRYSAREFDGKSDECLQHTWPLDE